MILSDHTSTKISPAAITGKRNMRISSIDFVVFLKIVVNQVVVISTIIHKVLSRSATPEAVRIYRVFK